jgi:class 3 adenylate cyclase
MGLLLALSRGPDRAPDFILATLVFAILGIIHYRVIGSRFDRWWVKYAFLTLDVVLLSAAVALVPPTPEAPLPQIFMFRFNIFPFYFIILGVAAFSFSPGLVLWAGVVGSAGWVGAFLWVQSQMAAPLDWSDIPDNPTAEQFLQVFLSPDFTASGSRAQEAVIYLVVAILIAIVMRRARQTVRRQLEAERDMTAISQIFGRFVPEAVAESMIRNKGVLDPTERQATVLFSDLAGFTRMMEAKGPRAIVDTLNAFFDDASEIIGRRNGVVTQFQGDGILATFNVPLEDEDHAQNAFAAANDLIELVRAKSFGGETLEIRIGLSTGPLVAGSVGGGGRQSYTVYGDPVNLAARLESLNKAHGTSVLISQSTATLLHGADLRHIGEVEIRGLSAPIGLYTNRTGS